MGSSSTNSVAPFPPPPRWEASLSRCASPPDSVVPGCPSRRYPSPTRASGRSPLSTGSSPSKNASASSTVMRSTSSTLRPRRRTRRTSGRNRFPPHSGQGTKTSARNCISRVSWPAPSHRSHRPPGELKEKVPAENRRARASAVAAKALRIGVHAPA